MKFAFHLCLFMLLISCQEHSSNSADREKFGPIILDESDPNFVQAYTILQNRCMNCHNYHQEWARYNSSQAWITANLVARGDPANSLLIRRTKNTTGPEANMPVGRPALPSQEYDFLLKWISEIP